MAKDIKLVGDAIRAVHHRGSHLQIIASAGSGKTEVVAQRVVDLLATGAEPASVVAFTFTRRAAESLKSRIGERVEDHPELGPAFLDRLSGCYVGTIHGYCLSLLQAHVPRYETYDVLDEHRLAAFITREASHIGVKDLTGKLFSSIREFVASVDVVDNEMLGYDRLEDPFREMVEKFHARLEEYRFLTYGRLVAVAVRVLEQPEVLAAVHGPLCHLVVDEYQDVNPAQEALISRLAAAPVELCVVGDDDQAIYQWRGADVANIVGFAKRYPGVATFRLTTNRRSRPGIVEAANGVAAGIAGRLEKAMDPDRPPGPPEVVTWRAPTEADEAELVASAVVRLRGQGYRYRDMAVLARSRTSYPRLLDAFHLHGIPVATGGRTGLFLSSDPQLFGRTFAWLADHSWRETEHERGETISLDQLVASYEEGFALAPAATAGLRRRLEAWNSEVATPTRPANLVRAFYELLAECGVGAWDLSDPVLVSRLGSLARCSAILSDYESVRLRPRPDVKHPGEVVGGQDRGVWFHTWLAIHIQNWAMGSFEAFDGEEDAALDAVDLTTVHQAKGLEWPVVFVPCVSAKRFPSKNTGSHRPWHVPLRVFSPARYEGSVEDERRLFYVALTRARDWLSVSTHDTPKKQSVAPSPFLLELAGGTPPTATSLELPPRIEQAADEEEPVASIAFSDLARYKACGFAYRLRALVGFQPPLAPELGYGKAVHHILREVAEGTRRRGAPPTRAQVERLFDDNFALPAANKEVHHRLKEAARALVGRYICDWGEDLERVWEVERPFELHLPGAVIAGRADVILDKEGGQVGSLAIVDYKTATDGEGEHDLQLQVYADAARREGLAVRGAYVHDLTAGDRDPVDVSTTAIGSAEATVVSLVERLRDRDFPASPSRATCSRCDVRPLCRWAV